MQNSLKGKLAALPKDYYGGGLMVLVGAGAAAIASTYSIGTLSRMGPGFFPVALGVLLVLVGLGVVFAAWLEQAPAAAIDHHTKPPEWRGWACIAGSVIAFVVLGHYGGFVPATAAISFISALGDRDNSVKDALLMAIGTVAVLVVVFWWGLQMTFPLFAWGVA